MAATMFSRGEQRMTTEGATDFTTFRSPCFTALVNILTCNFYFIIYYLFLFFFNIAGGMAATMFSRGAGGEQRATTEGPQVSPHSGAPPSLVRMPGQLHTSNNTGELHYAKRSLMS